MKKHPKSLIAKIYGVYEFKGLNRSSICLILMKNIAGFSKECIQRTYDLKGSRYDRQVIKSAFDEKKAGKYVLKDLDFLKLEQKIYISEADKQNVIEILQKDALFLQSCGLIDYSLQVFKIKFEEKNHFEELYCFKSIKEENVWYFIGIIDYLQKYDVMKKMEKYAKKVINFNWKLDTSS